MFNYLSGEIVQLDNGKVVVDIGGIGYEVFASSYTLAECKIGCNQRLFTYLQVREDDISLYGFATMQEKNMFLHLISVSGVGAKVAIAILSGLDSNSLANAIFTGDTKALTRIKGLGKKTAERLILELKEKVVVDGQTAVTPLTTNPDIPLTKAMSDAIAVLCSLGKSQMEAEKLVEAASKLGANTTEELINLAFRIN
ncbi:MAG: Holliday junction branch migration protein RuvA [Clostridia bacterium]|nr:Holliday junction branch migration protein RuvA [Clostridia bacterium]